MVVVWLRRWLLFAVGVPLVAWALDQARQQLEARGGPSGLSRTLGRASHGMRRLRRGRRR